MKILLDHSVPHPLRHTLPDHEVHTTYYRGWHLQQNGDLISNAVAGGYEMLITCDQSIRSQQNLLQQPITVLTITTNDWTTIRNNLSLIETAIRTAQPGHNNLLSLRPPL